MTIFSHETTALNVTSNDIFPSGCNATTVTIVQEPTQGTVTVNGVTVTYIPDNPCYEGEDTFTYTVSCTRCICGTSLILTSEEALVTITLEHECDMLGCGDDCFVCDDGTALGCC